MNIREELHGYLGKNYEPHKLNWPTERLEAVLKQYGNLTAFEEQDKEALYLHTFRTDDGWYLPHLAFFREVVPPDMSVLEVHANIGLYGVRLVTDYRFRAVSFLDHKTKCTPFLRWRLKWRQLKSPIYEPGDDIPAHDAVMAFESVHRYKEPWEFIQRLTEYGKVIVLDIDSRRSDSKRLLKQINKTYRVIRHKTVNHYIHFVAFTPIVEV